MKSREWKPPRGAVGYKLKNPYWIRLPVCNGFYTWFKISQIKTERIVDGPTSDSAPYPPTPFPPAKVFRAIEEDTKHMMKIHKESSRALKNRGDEARWNANAERTVKSQLIQRFTTENHTEPLADSQWERSWLESLHVRNVSRGCMSSTDWIGRRLTAMGEMPLCSKCQFDKLPVPAICFDCLQYCEGRLLDKTHFKPRPKDFKKAVRKKFGKPIDWSEVCVEEVEKPWTAQGAG
jgi:hypothetical protein